MTKKVLHLITSLTEGGAQKILTDVCRYGSKQNIHRVVCLKDGRYSNILKRNGIIVYKLNFKKNPIKSINRLLIIINKEFNPHILHTWLYHCDFIGYFIKLFWKRKDKKLFWNIRNGTLHKKTSSLYTRLIRRFLILLSYIGPDKIIYCSKVSEKFMNQLVTSRKLV